MAEVSVCIPTCNRPNYLKKAVNSVLSQNFDSVEVVVGDDSGEENKKKTSKVLNGIEKSSKIRYLPNNPPLGESKNVNKLFKKSEGKYIILLHDDDQLVDGSIDTLYRHVDSEENIVAAYGKQYIINPSEDIIWDETRAINEVYNRGGKFVGKQKSALRAAITQQFPGDGYIVRADIARNVGYDHQPKAGDAHDFTFGIEFAKHTNGNFKFVDEFTAKYCFSKESQTRGESTYPDNAFRSVKIVMDEFPEMVKNDPLVREWLQNQSPVAVMQAAQNGYTEEGFQLYFSSHHRNHIPTLGGGRRLLALIRSIFYN